MDFESEISSLELGLEDYFDACPNFVVNQCNVTQISLPTTWYVTLTGLGCSDIFSSARSI